MKYLFLLMFIMCITGCKKAEKNPELLDPIYLDIKSDADSVQKAVDDAEKELAIAKKDLDTITPQTRERVEKRNAYFMAEKKLSLLKERLQYQKVRLNDRLQYSKKSYIEAFNSDKPWPNPKDYQMYMKGKEQQNISLRWDDHLQKYFRRAAPKKEASRGGSHEGSREGSEGGEGGGGHGER